MTHDDRGIGVDIDPRCEKCGHPRGRHHYRHVFVGPTFGETIEALVAEIAALGARVDLARGDAIEEVAKFVETHEVGVRSRVGYVVAPSALDGTMGTHPGMAYAKAIRAMRGGDT